MICEKLNDLFCKVIKNPLTRAYILAVGRHLITIAGGALVAHGYLHGDDVSDFLGFATTVVGIYLSSMDVKNVDQKIKTAEQLPPPVT